MYKFLGDFSLVSPLLIGRGWRANKKI